MKKSKLSVVALVISLLPFITLLISLFSEKITGGLQMGLTALNVISILLGLGLSISVRGAYEKYIDCRRFSYL